jgi:hypothetical protein
MATLRDARKAIDEYNAVRRHPGIQPFKVSEGLYSLDKEVLCPTGETVARRWPATYEHADERGVYLIFDASLQLLYVGKASMQNTIANRLATYFMYDEIQRCRVVHTKWSARPAFLLTVAAASDAPEQAAALEEYLIRMLDPSDNTRGVLR